MPEVMELNDALPVERVRLPHAFTKENAAEMARRAVEARKRNEILREQQKEQATVEANQTDDGYRTAQLERVRAQLERLHNKLARSQRAAHIRDITHAIKALAEVERQLAGRPLPSAKTQRAPDAPRTSAANPIG